MKDEYCVNGCGIACLNERSFPLCQIVYKSSKALKSLEKITKCLRVVIKYKMEQWCTQMFPQLSLIKIRSIRECWEIIFLFVNLVSGRLLLSGVSGRWTIKSHKKSKIFGYSIDLSDCAIFYASIWIQKHYVAKCICSVNLFTFAIIIIYNFIERLQN